MMHWGGRTMMHWEGRTMMRGGGGGGPGCTGGLPGFREADHVLVVRERETPPQTERD